MEANTRDPIPLLLPPPDCDALLIAMPYHRPSKASTGGIGENRARHSTLQRENRDVRQILEGDLGISFRLLD